MTNESQLTQANDVAMDATGRFERGEGVEELYGRMRPDQRTAIAGEFIRLLALAGDDHTEQFRTGFQEHTQLTPAATDKLLTADQVSAVDSYVRQKHPEMIAQMLRHPVTQSALTMPGAQTAESQDMPAIEDKIRPTGNVVTSGAAHRSAWMMMELGGEEANRLTEDPHEQAVTPSGEAEKVQRDVENAGEEGEPS